MVVWVGLEETVVNNYYCVSCRFWSGLIFAGSLWKGKGSWHFYPSYDGFSSQFLGNLFDSLHISRSSLFLP